VSSADLVTPSKVAEIVAVVEAVTRVVETVKVALVAPAATVTLAGTVVTAVLLLAKATTAPPACAAALRVTVPVEGFPPPTLVGFRLKEERVAGGGDTVSTADFVTPPNTAEIVTAVEAVTELVNTVKFSVVAPAATVTLAGTVAIAVLLLASATTTPPAGATALTVNVPVEGVPPITLVGLRLTEERVVVAWITVSTAELATPP